MILSRKRAINTYFDKECMIRFADPNQDGEIITFYSYKGGTGRSIALANCAGLMAACWPEQAKPMLLVDFDLEAPGLHQYLKDFLPSDAKNPLQQGTLELFTSLSEKVELLLREAKTETNDKLRLSDQECDNLIQDFDFKPYLVPVSFEKSTSASTSEKCWLIQAGMFDSEYGQKLAKMNWQQLFDNAPGIFRSLASYWKSQYACILIDSRTGLSDSSSICSTLLPDVLTVVFTPNRQSLAGITHVTEFAKNYRQRSADLRPLRVYPLASRIEQNSEDYRNVWRYGAENHHVFGKVEGYQPLFEELLQPAGEEEQVCTTSAQEGMLDNYFAQVFVPHSPDYAFGERLCFVSSAARDRYSLRQAYETFLPWLVTGAEPWQYPADKLSALKLANLLQELAPPELELSWLDNWLRDGEHIQQQDPLAKIDNWISSLQDGKTVKQLKAMEASLRLEPANEELLTILPNLVLLLALHKLQSQRWKELQQLLSEAEELLGGYGLNASFENAATSWLLRTLTTAPRLVFSAMEAGAITKLSHWLDAIGLSRSGSWVWLHCLVRANIENYHAPTIHELRLVSKLENLLEQQQSLLGDTNQNTLYTKRTLAKIYFTQGDLTAACRLQELVLEACERILDPEHPDTITSKAELAETFRAQGDLDSARRLEVAVLEARERTLGPEHPDTLSSKANLASTLWQRGDLAGARRLEEAVLEALERTLGAEHPSALISKNNLAGTLKAQGDLVGARRLDEAVLEASERTLGAEHPSTLTSKANLASTLKAQGGLAGARRLEEAVLEARERTLGAEHPDTLTSKNNLASTLWQQGDLTGARHLQEAVLEARERTLGAEHPDTLTSKNNLAGTLAQQGDLAGARHLQEAVLEALERTLGAEHPNTLSSKNNLAGTLKAQGDLAGARHLQEAVLEARERILGAEHPSTLTSKNNLAGTLKAQGDLAGARYLEEAVLDSRECIFGTEHPSTLTSKHNLAVTLRQLKEHEPALQLMKNAYEGRVATLSKQHPDAMDSGQALLDLMLEMELHQEARALSKELHRANTGSQRGNFDS
ncbi:tetratricopeptide repeat protein [Rheinheimera gaetbuli]